MQSVDFHISINVLLFLFIFLVSNWTSYFWGAINYDKLLAQFVCLAFKKNKYKLTEYQKNKNLQSKHIYLSALKNVGGKFVLKNANQPKNYLAQLFYFYKATMNYFFTTFVSLLEIHCIESANITCIDIDCAILVYELIFWNNEVLKRISKSCSALKLYDIVFYGVCKIFVLFCGNLCRVLQNSLNGTLLAIERLRLYYKFLQ